MDISFQELLRISLTCTGLTPPELAAGLDRERSSVYKWLSGKHQPKLSYLPQMVSLLLGHATAAQKIILRKQINDIVNHSSLPGEIKKTLLSDTDDDFSFLQEVFTLALSDTPVRQPWTHMKSPSRPSEWVGRNALLIVIALTAAALGGILWNVTNLLFSWTYHTGGPNNEPYGLSAVLWGILSLTPVILLAEIYAKKPFPASNALVQLAAYLAVGGLSALVFYSGGIRSFLESHVRSYEIREVIIVLLYAALISLPPYAALRVLGKTVQAGKATAIHIVLPIGLSLMAVLLSFLIRRPEVEVAGIRGLLVGLLMRTGMFFAAARAIQSETA